MLQYDAMIDFSIFGVQRFKFNIGDHCRTVFHDVPNSTVMIPVMNILHHTQHQATNNRNVHAIPRHRFQVALRHRGPQLLEQGLAGLMNMLPSLRWDAHDEKQVLQQPEHGTI